MAHVVTGGLNKQIAADMQISEITVKVHRSHLMQQDARIVAAGIGAHGGPAGALGDKR